MKRIIYALLFLSTAAWAQLPGYHPALGYAYENFTSNDLVWSSQGPRPQVIDSLIEVVNGIKCVRYMDSFSYSIQKDKIKKQGNVNVSQPYGRFETFGFSFGKETNGRQKVLDLSKGNANVKFTVRNFSNYSLSFYVSLTDSAGKIVDAVGTRNFNQGYLDWLSYWDIKPDESRTISINLNKNAYHWVLDTLVKDCYRVQGADKDSSFNKKIVSALRFAVVNNDNAGDFDGFKPYSIDNAILELSNILIGSVDIATDIERDEAQAGIRAFPNPVKDRLLFSKPLDNVLLTDMSGQNVYGSDRATEIDVQSLPKGMYVLRSSSLERPVKVMIE